MIVITYQSKLVLRTLKSGETYLCQAQLDLFAGNTTP